MNSYVNTKTNIKKLQFGVSKCHKMHVGAKKNNCPSLKIDELDVKLIEDYDTNENIVKDE